MGMAAALLVVLGLKMEIRMDSRQLVLGWGRPPVSDSAPEPKLQVAPERTPAPPPPPEVTAADVRLLRDLVHNLAAAVEERDSKFQQYLALVEFQLNQVQEQASARWAARNLSR